MKFGGTSVRNKEAIERVISIVSNRMSENPLVVVSALSKVTRLLCEICKEAESQHVDKVNELLADLRERHVSLAESLLSGGDGSRLEKCVADMESVLDSLSEFAHGVCCIGELSPRSYARIVSTGEILSSMIIAAAMNESGLATRWLDARKMILTDCNYISASPDLATTEANVKRLVSEASKGVSVIITQGFIASASDGATSVLGFEGSDYSAAIFGMALDASRVEIWTDVDGIRSADPRIVNDTVCIRNVSYDEASEMAFLGARVLHPLTIEPARKKNIPVYVLNSQNPSCKGSKVSVEKNCESAKTITLKDDIDFLDIISDKIVGVTAMMAAVFSAAEKAGVKIILSSVSESRARVTMETGQPGFEQMVAELRKRFTVMIYRDKAQFSIVGEKFLHSCPGLASRIEKVLPGSVYLVCMSPVQMSLSYVIDKEYAVDVVSHIHELMFPKES